MKITIKRKPDQISLGICVTYGKLVESCSIGLVWWVLSFNRVMPVMPRIGDYS